MWERWLALDPVRMVPRHADALRGMRAIYIDAGTRDEYFLDLGAEAFRAALAAIGVTDVRFELFDATTWEHRLPLPDRAAVPGGAAVAPRPVTERRATRRWPSWLR